MNIVNTFGQDTGLEDSDLLPDIRVILPWRVYGKLLFLI